MSEKRTRNGADGLVDSMESTSEDISDAVDKIHSTIRIAYSGAEIILNHPGCGYEGKEKLRSRMQQHMKNMVDAGNEMLKQSVSEKGMIAYWERMKKDALAIVNDVYHVKKNALGIINAVGEGLWNDIKEVENQYWSRIIENGLAHKKDTRIKKEDLPFSTKGVPDGIEHVLSFARAMFEYTTREELEPYIAKHAEILRRVDAQCDRFKSTGLVEMSVLSHVRSYGHAIINGSHGDMVMMSNLVGHKA